MSHRKHFLLVSWDGGGNLGPELSVARKLLARGHGVRLLGDPTLEPEARASGCTFSPWTTAPHKKAPGREHDVFKDYEMSGPLELIDTYMREFLAAPAPRWVDDTLRELQARPVDAMLVDFALPATLIAAEKLSIPSATLMPNIWIIPTRGIPPLGPGFLPAKGIFGRARDAIVRGMMERVFQRALPSLNATRQAHGLRPLGDVYEQLLGADEILVQTSPVFDFTSPHQPAKAHYVGPELEDPAWSKTAEAGARWQPPFPVGDERPLVLVGLSSTFQDQVGTLRRIVDALARLPVRALITLGPALDPVEVPGAENVVVVRSAPHAQVLERAALLITHCGHGTTLKGLAAGVPLVCLPMGRDQNDTAARVVASGAGVRLKPAASTERIAAAVQRVLGDPAFRAAAARLQRSIATREGCSDAVEVLEGLASTPPGARRVAAA